MPFFPPPFKTEDTGLAVTEDPSDGCGGTKTGETIGIVEATVFLHTEILPSFREDEKPVTSGNISRFQMT